MKKFFNSINDWCNAHIGLLALLTLIATCLTLVPSNKINFGFTNTFFDKLFTVLSYKLKIPIFIFVLLTIAFLIYFLVIRRKYKHRSISLKFLIGTWRNEWKGEDFHGTQVFQITRDGDYILAGQPAFKIKDFEYDPRTAQIKFAKVGLQSNDPRILINTLKLINNDLLTGTEDFYNITYTRLSN